MKIQEKLVESEIRLIRIEEKLDHVREIFISHESRDSEEFKKLNKYFLLIIIGLAATLGEKFILPFFS